MKKSRNAFTAIFASLAAATSANAQPAPAQHLLDSVREISAVPGMSAAVSKNGEIIWSGQSGVAELEAAKPVNADTKFRTASVSKLFAATLALQLAEEGKLDLDADIRNYVPDWPDHDGAVITLRQLAAHTSGMPHYDGGDHYDASVLYDTLNDSLSIYAHKSLLFAPGEGYSYSSYGYALMGAAVENVTKESFADVLDRYVTGRLSLTETSAENIHALPPNTSHLFIQRGGEIPRNDQHHVLGATGILTTPSDLVEFADAFMSGALVRSETVEDALTPATLTNGKLAGETRFAVGFGWRVGKNWEGEDVAHHAGITPGARSILTYNRDRHITAALLSNAMWTSRIETTGELIATAATEMESLAEARCPVGEWAYDGSFVSNPQYDPKGLPANGRLSIHKNGDLCTGAFDPRGALADWMTELNAGDSIMRVTLVAKRPTGLVFAVATPWGAFPMIWRAGDEHKLSGDIAGRALTLHMFPTPSAAPPLP
ncbi:serine hydrolase domain-containing protein [Hyphococcus sp.]|uniref:serine hydrolase domain-containing protein n=1 Tax=Hyphococcus sp. TaxID=2038636 RepID=UPI00208D28B6|nr:MAG: hypothetical protein DHS20C04_14530 [Marinicaulis sp.]